MSNFYEKAKSVQSNVSVTENGMVGYQTTTHLLADFNFKVASYRTQKKAAINDFKALLASEEQYILKYLFYLRDVREGLGERDLFRVCITRLLNCKNIENKDEIMHVIIEQTPEFGRWDDLLVFLNTPYQDAAVSVIKAQLQKDVAGYLANKPISLLAKWLPSENATSRKARQMASLLIKVLGTTPREYRKTLSSLRKYLDVLEVKACANEWDAIDYNKVPSKANLKYKYAFIRHDEKRRREFLSKVLLGDKDVKVHMGVSFPHEIVHSYCRCAGRVKDYDQSLEAYWANLKPCVGLKDTIVVRDGSGSMGCRIGNTDLTALDVSTALAIYCSQYLGEGFKDKFITFSHEAKIIDLSTYHSLHRKLEHTFEEDDCSNTDIQNVFELLLDTAIEGHMTPEEMPSTVLIVSDMEFDPSHDNFDRWSCGMNGGSNVFKTMSIRFKAAGYQLPKLVFWNVNSRTGTIPCNYNENGVLLISGFSQNVLSMVMNGETDPYKALIKELDKERYAAIPLISFTEVGKSVNGAEKGLKDTPAFLK